MATKTVTILAGNTDNKLSQEKWAEFCDELRNYLDFVHCNFQFSAPSIGWQPWQNCAFVFVCDEGNFPAIKEYIASIRTRYSQDSVAWVEGTTEFI